MQPGRHEQKALLEIANMRALGLKLSAVVAVFGIVAFFMDAIHFTIVALLLIAAVNIGTHFEDKRKLRTAYQRDLEDGDVDRH